MRFFPWQELPLQWIGMYASKSAAFAASPRRGKRPRENVSTSESCSNDGGGARVRKRDSESERARVRLDFRTRSTLHLGHIDAVIGRLFQTKVVKSARQSAELVHVR